MGTYAVIRSGIVENLVVWDGKTNFSPEGCEVVKATSDAHIGGTYDGNFHYVAPTPPEPTAEQVAAAETKASASEKLKALGLNDAEIASITGG